MGWLVPTITLLTVKLDRLKTSSKFCQPLITALQEGIQRRFGDMLADPELIAAAILLPKFRTSWTSNEDLLKLGKSFKWLLNWQVFNWKGSLAKDLPCSRQLIQKYVIVTRRKNTTAIVITIIMMVIETNSTLKIMFPLFCVWVVLCRYGLHQETHGGECRPITS